MPGEAINIRTPRVAVVRLCRALFGDKLSIVLTVCITGLAILVLPGLLRWMILDATFSGSAADCRENGGACWAFIAEKRNLILFGTYPVEQLWRPAVFLVLLAGIAVYGLVTKRTLGIFLALLAAALLIGIVLMRGGLPGLPLVENSRWGGLPVTMIVTLAGLGGAFPLGVLLMLGSVSRNAINVPCRIYIDIIRGVPAITLVFMTFAIIPLLTPDDVMIDKLIRASAGLTLLTAAYFAEALRGAHEALPKGQSEAGESLGIGYWKRQRLIILPQVIANSQQPIANIAIAFVKNTSLLIIIGLFDLLGSARASLFDGEWQGYYRELYLFLALIYLVICLFIDKYVAQIERERTLRTLR